MQTPAIIFGGVVVALVLGASLIVFGAVRRRRRGAAAMRAHGWERLPDGEDVAAGWGGWPFLRAKRPGSARDIVVGHHQGVRFMCLRWSQLESTASEGGSRGEWERYNIVALAAEHDYPPLCVVRGHRHSWVADLPSGLEEVDTGDARFDKRWQVVGDRGFGSELLTAEVRAAMDDLDHAWVFQPGWVTRVVPWRFYAGEDAMLEEIDRLVAPLRAVPHHVWNNYGGPPRFLSALGHGTQER